MFVRYFKSSFMTFFSWIRIRIFPDQILIFGLFRSGLRKKDPDPGKKIRNVSKDARGSAGAIYKGEVQEAFVSRKCAVVHKDRRIYRKELKVKKKLVYDMFPVGTV